MTDPAARFPEVILGGDARQRGHSHGEQLREAIHQTLDYYRGLFGIGTEALREQAAAFAAIIADFRPDYALEIEAIAAAAGLEPLFVHALNSRSEIYNNSIAECTSLINTHDVLLAQNWDWSQALEELVVQMTLEQEDGRRIRMLTEPGIIGKIGMNSSGLGVCLNILKHPGQLSGLPVHILLRAILDCDSLAQVEQLLQTVSVGKASHILVGDASGGCLSIEFAGGDSFQLEPEQGLLVHTNHYLAAAANSVDAFPTTHERLAQATAMLADDASNTGVVSLLRDQSQGVESICRPYSPSETAGFGNVGSVFTVVMALSEGAMQVYRGPATDTTPYRVTV